MKDIVLEVLQNNQITQQNVDLSPVIYVDLDGVLVDFESGFKKISAGVSKTEYIKTHGINKFWSLINSYGDNWWATLDWMPDGTRLWEYLQTKNVKILTSGSTRNTGTLAVTGKQRWVNNHLGAFKTIVVESSSHKKMYSSPGNILIDDLPSNISEWKLKGGIGILHKNTDTTLVELQEIIETSGRFYENPNL
jgi:hypothetical protein